MCVRVCMCMCVRHISHPSLDMSGIQNIATTSSTSVSMSPQAWQSSEKQKASGQMTPSDLDGSWPGVRQRNKQTKQPGWNNDVSSGLLLSNISPSAREVASSPVSQARINSGSNRKQLFGNLSVSTKTSWQMPSLSFLYVFTHY